METYINSGRDKYIVDPDKDKIYTKRKQRRIALNEPSEEPNTKQAKPTPFQPVYPSSGWSNDLKRFHFLLGRKLIFSFQIPAKNSTYTPCVQSNFRKATAFLQDEY